MINIKDKSACCGCSACVQVCPKKCISFNEDNEGFRYPSVDISKCVNCGLCEKVCPVINQNESHRPIKVYAAKNNNEDIRLHSSSGGIFTALAEDVINRGGVVFGARFDDNWEVKHDYTETIEGLSAFRGSKYLQSRIENTYLTAETFLKQGREVLFSGTPCQIAGLKRYLRREYKNLLAVDVVCHGAPSPLVWREYLKGCSNKQVIKKVNFRDKVSSWKKYKVVVEGDEDIVNQPFYENIFMRGFLRDIYLRPSCYACPSKNGKSGADITLGDFWGIENHYPEFDDDKGCGLILLNTLKLNDLLAEKCDLQETTFEKVATGNPCILHSVDTPANYRYFWKVYAKSKDLENTLTTIHDPRFLMRLRRLIFRKIGI